VKQVASAIMGSDLSLTPVADAQNPLLLNMPIPPPTKESRLAVVAEAKKYGEKALGAVRDARQVTHKSLREMKVKKTARGDDVRKAEKKMEGVVEEGLKGVKGIVKKAEEVLEKA
jgi:ribosome recycling factor